MGLYFPAAFTPHLGVPPRCDDCRALLTGWSGFAHLLMSIDGEIDMLQCHLQLWPVPQAVVPEIDSSFSEPNLKFTIQGPGCLNR